MKSEHTQRNFAETRCRWMVQSTWSKDMLSRRPHCHIHAAI